MAENNISIISLGNGCEASIFLRVLDILTPSPLDYSFFKNSPLTLIKVFNGDMEKAVKNGNWKVIDNPGYEFNNSKKKKFSSLVIDDNNEIIFPYVGIESLALHLPERFEIFNKAMTLPNTVYVLNDGPVDRFLKLGECERLLQELPFLKSQLMAVTTGITEEFEYMRYFNIPVVSFADYFGKTERFYDFPQSVFKQKLSTIKNSDVYYKILSAYPQLSKS